MLQRDASAKAAARRNPPEPEVLRDARAVLAGAVQRLREATGCELALAIPLTGDAAPDVACAAFEGPPPLPPDEAALAAAATLPGATDLADDAASLLRGLVRPRPSGAVVPVRGAGGQLLALLLVAYAERRPVRPRTLALLDATARRIAAPLDAATSAARLSRLDAELRRANRLATLGAVAAEVAHELRSPLVAVKAFLDLLPERPDDPQLLEKFLPVVREELARAERLLGLVVDYPREHEEARSAALTPALEAVTALLSHLPRARGVRVETELPPALPELAIGPDALRQLLLNLALNAVEASPKGGHVALVARRADGGVEIQVEDAGPGVADTEHARIFEPFHSTRAAGHGGLGLAICRRIAQEAGGTIEVASGDAGGCVFRVWLPEASAEAGHGTSTR